MAMFGGGAVVSLAVALPCALFLFPGQSVLYRILLAMGLAIMSSIWVATVFLTGMKQYRAILYIFAIGYGITVFAAMLLRYTFGLEEQALRIETAVKKVLAQGYRTGDIYERGTNKVGTKEMGDAVLAALA